MLLCLFLIGVIAEALLMITPWLWAHRRTVLPINVMLVSLWTGAALFSYTPLLSLILAGISFYRLINLLRIGYDKAHNYYLRHGGRRTSLILIFVQTLFYISGLSLGSFEYQTIYMLVVSVQLLTGMLLLAIVVWNLHKTLYHPLNKFYTDKELPTLTVAIPARNETQDLSSCLQSIIANNYPKLEILVLDDCSQDRTSEIIKDFAQDGVRFIRGDNPKDGWLAKNQAYDKLLREATGEIVMFCGVDTRFGADTLRQLVTAMLNKKRDMISIMPLRIGGRLSTAIIQPMRYWWEVALPRRLFNRPPALSTCWLIKRQAAKRLGGFAAVSQTIRPEVFFARELIKNDRYAFLRSHDDVDVRTLKSAAAQLDTAVRTRYPQMHRRPENVLLLTAVFTLIYIAPVVILIHGFIFGLSALHGVSLIGLVIHTVVHMNILMATNPSNSLVGLINLPLVVVTEIVLLNLSMLKYEFGVVDWKGRNICIPVMQVIPKEQFLANQNK